jgi:hypothetical protein
MSNRNRRKTRKTPRRAHASHAIESFSYTLPNGTRALYVGDAIRESDPPAVREGLARRRMLATEGHCPCGARVPFDPRIIAPAVASHAIEHASDCPAADANLAAAMRNAGRRAA